MHMPHEDLEDLNTISHFRLLDFRKRLILEIIKIHPKSMEYVIMLSEGGAAIGISVYLQPHIYWATKELITDTFPVLPTIHTH